MADKPLINLRVDAKQKAEWEQYVEDSGRFSTVSGLIRASVESEINDESPPPSVESPGLASDVEDLQEEVERIRKDVRWLRQQQQDAVDLSDIAQEVFATLQPLPDSPVLEVPDNVDDQDDFRREEAAQQVIRPDSEDDTRSPQTSAYLADELGVDEATIEDAIEHLQEQFLPVVAVEIDGKTHYFKEE